MMRRFDLLPWLAALSLGALLGTASNAQAQLDYRLTDLGDLPGAARPCRRRQTSTRTAR